MWMVQTLEQHSNPPMPWQQEAGLVFMASFWPWWHALLVPIKRVPAKKKIPTYFSPFSYTFHHPDPTGVQEITATSLSAQLFLWYTLTQDHTSWSHPSRRNPSKDATMGTLTLKWFPTNFITTYLMSPFWAPQASLDPFSVSSFLCYETTPFCTPLYASG